MYKNSEPLLLSGLQHFSFCRRQWALIHIEQQWAENWRTAEGDILHRRAHDDEQFEARGDVLVARGLKVFSSKLNVTGVCDVVEFHRDPAGIRLEGRDGAWQVCPIEYKKGEPKQNDADRLQLCGQALCLEEMLACTIPKGFLYYGEIRRREQVVFSPQLRNHVAEMLAEMHQYVHRGYTPQPLRTKACNACSLKELCLPGINRLPSVSDYLARHIKEDESCENS